MTNRGSRLAAAWPKSITGRLTLYYAGATILLLLIASGFLYWSLTQALASQDRRLVASKLQVLRHLLQEQADKPDALASEIEHEGGAGQPLNYYMRILDDRGGTVLETPGMGAILSTAAFPDPVPDPDEPQGCTGCRLSSNGQYLLLAGEAAVAVGTARTAKARPERRIMQVALDVTHNDATLAGYRRRLLAVLGLGLLISATTGAMVARAGMKPLREISRRIPLITASRLDERLVATYWPSELSGMAAEFDAMLDRLEESFTRLTQFSADIAHALRNPVNSLRGEAEVALGRARTPDEYQQVLGSSLEELERLSRLIDGLLFIARADDPQVALEHTRFDARREMNAVQEFYEALADELEVAVTCEGEAHLTGDPVMFRRAVSNLLANALKNTPGKGSVTLAVRQHDDGGIELEVRDTGHGIAAEHLPRLFDRFYQVPDARARPAVGSGLGLAIVQSIMRMHGGAATIASSVGHGTTVTLTFPASGADTGPQGAGTQG